MTGSLEKTIQAEIERAIGAEPDLLLMRNAVGRVPIVHEDGKRTFVSFGLGAGTPDLVGILTAPSGLGVWFGLEIKAEGGRLRKTQERTIPVWWAFGAQVYTVRSVAEARTALETARKAVRR